MLILSCGKDNERCKQQATPPPPYVHVHVEHRWQLQAVHRVSVLVPPRMTHRWGGAPAQLHQAQASTPLGLGPTLAPSLARLCAQAKPMPLAAPVMIATLPASLAMAPCTQAYTTHCTAAEDETELAATSAAGDLHGERGGGEGGRVADAGPSRRGGDLTRTSGRQVRGKCGRARVACTVLPRRWTSQTHSSIASRHAAAGALGAPTPTDAALRQNTKTLPCSLGTGPSGSV